MPEARETKPIEAKNEANTAVEAVEVVSDLNIDDMKEVSLPVKELGPGAKRRKAARLPVGPGTDQEQEAIRVAESRKLPKLPGYRPTWEQAEAYVQGLTPPQWSRLFAYVWRRKPIIIRDPKYIDVISEQQDFRREYIKSTHGGGKYKIGLQDAETRAGKNVMIMDIALDIPLTEADPILDLTELDVGDKTNKTYVERLKARGILDMDGNEITKKTNDRMDDSSMIGLLKEVLGQMSKMQMAQVQEAASRRGEDPESRVLEKTIGMMERGSDSREKLLIERIREQDPSKTWDMIDKIMTKMTPKNDAFSSGDVFKQLLDMQASGHKSQMDMMEKLVELKTSGGDDDTKMLERIKLYREIIEPMGGRSGKTHWSENLFSVLPTVLEYTSRIVGSIVAARMKLPATTPGMASTPPPPPMGGGGESVINPTSISSATNPSANSQQPSETSGTSDTPETRVDANEFISQYGGIILNAISQGTPGDQFAESITQLYGLAIYHIASNIGKNNLLAAMQNNAEFMQHAKPLWPQVETFVDEFLSFGSSTADESPPPMGVEGKANELSNEAEEEGENNDS